MTQSIERKQEKTIRNKKKTSPPPAPRSRPSVLAPRAKALGPVRPDSSLPPAPPAGGLDTLQYPTHKKAPEVARGHSLRSVALRYERARSLITLRSIESREPPSLREPSLGASSLVAPSLRCSSLGASSLVLLSSVPLRSESPCPLSRYPLMLQR